MCCLLPNTWQRAFAFPGGRSPGPAPGWSRRGRRRAAAMHKGGPCVCGRARPVLLLGAMPVYESGTSPACSQRQRAGMESEAAKPPPRIHRLGANNACLTATPAATSCATGQQAAPRRPRSRRWAGRTLLTTVEFARSLILVCTSARLRRCRAHTIQLSDDIDMDNTIFEAFLFVTSFYVDFVNFAGVEPPSRNAQP